MSKLPRHRPLSRTQSSPLPQSPQALPHGALPHGTLQHHFLDKQQVQLGKVGQGLPWGWERERCRVWGGYGAGVGRKWGGLGAGAGVGWPWVMGWVWAGYGVAMGHGVDIGCMWGWDGYRVRAICAVGMG